MDVHRVVAIVSPDHGTVFDDTRSNGTSSRFTAREMTRSVIARSRGGLQPCFDVRLHPVDFYLFIPFVISFNCLSQILSIVSLVFTNKRSSRIHAADARTFLRCARHVLSRGKEREERKTAGFPVAACPRDDKSHVRRCTDGYRRNEWHRSHRPAVITGS